MKSRSHRLHVHLFLFRRASKLSLGIAKQLAFIIICLSMPALLIGQEFPSPVENVAYITTFGKNASTAWGDDDYVQTYFFAVPKQYEGEIHLRVFDPDVGGEVDAQMRGAYDTKTSFEVFGGQGAYSEPDARSIQPEGNYKSGTRLLSKTFGVDAETDNRWVTLGTVSIREGEWDPDLRSYVFKVIVEGVSGDDGNLYRFFLSSNADANVEIPGSNPFTYELCFRIKATVAEQAHFYPFVESDVVAVRIHNFDLDLGAEILVNSVARQDVSQPASGDGEWVTSKIAVAIAEHDTSLDYVLRTSSNGPNDMTVYFTNQYGEAIPFFSKPIGGIPRYGYKSSSQIIYQE